MALIPYEGVVQYYNDNATDINNILAVLEHAIKDGRDNRGLPVYLTKQRLKSINSIYLKIRRRLKKALDDIRDYGGLRVLCLFEQDIPELHQYITGVFRGFLLEEFNVFNWGRRDGAYVTS